MTDKPLLKMENCEDLQPTSCDGDAFQLSQKNGVEADCPSPDTGRTVISTMDGAIWKCGASFVSSPLR